VKVGRAGIPLEQPLHPATLLPIFLLYSIKVKKLVLQMVSKGPTLLVEAPLVSRLIQLSSLPKQCRFEISLFFP
jgi:hypothetical protein